MSAPLSARLSELLAKATPPGKMTDIHFRDALQENAPQLIAAQALAEEVASRNNPQMVHALLAAWRKAVEARR